jgi:ABC-type Fe3+/spermidine/putrescine transport system ATPase subunit
MIKPLLTVAAAVLLFNAPLHAQTTQSKKDLIAKIIQLQQPGLEALARQLVEQPALQLMQQAGGAIQRLSAERREAVAADVQADARKYVEETFPLVRDKATKAAAPLVAPALEERFTEDELKQIIATMESPVLKRFQGTLAEFQRPITEKTVADSRSVVEPKLKAFQESMAKRLGITPPPPAPSASGNKK